MQDSFRKELRLTADLSLAVTSLINFQRVRNLNTKRSVPIIANLKASLSNQTNQNPKKTYKLPNNLQENIIRISSNKQNLN